ncbi:NAD(P)H-dependent oxidoreductase [Cyclobacterium amurskyense]|uniref:Nitroreductase n=1 Tax=Cyclobacterium amurskyense TaxID=320787 RepID=A0A0H4PGS0_9BACT|nr:NAD(P)H-dependent oxidoreductase [Cyclobacterium amurskyense]AKP53389.1 nitroreductase [Cyclobacterium amurskyense]|tara:strand:+ start:2845 stop:3477 length:633 start_codon:yes stop_codon:yes gene_type:complete
MNLLEKLNWRYATKAFDPSKKVPENDLNFLKEAIRLSVSSYGLQMYKVLIIENPEIRKELRKASWEQAQITDASHLFIFCNYTINHDQHVDDHIQLIIDTQQIVDDHGLKKYAESIKSNIANMTSEERRNWTEKQTYLALNSLIIACADRQIDACPMEGFDKQAYNRILGLDEMGLNASVIAPVGYRSKSDEAQLRKKVRKPIKELFLSA